ncbi:hypothetical protein C8A00DRAFT_38983 [Chaetomidium leptoderma]|uniref:Helicase ATP-binding domain-containing protein n=1 Tax=Chaetomidium leptoderma TaxID=669021 RepID=A0AAN6ZSC8_9PEZI|nr:hypothetical protein C8A00DRAFT_38983 [Chaetomidium leptoderma]
MEPFTFLSQYDVVVCTLCKRGTAPTEALTHLSTAHKNILPEDRYGIVQQVLRLPTPYKTNEDFKDFPYPTSPLRRVGWATHLAGLDFNELRRTISLGEKDGWPSDTTSARVDFPWYETQERGESILKAAWDSVTRVIRAAHKGCTYDVVGFSLCYEIGRKSVHVKPSKPFSSSLQPDTLQRYINLWRSIVGFVFRTYDLPHDMQPPYRMTSEQHDILQDWWRGLASSDEEETIDRDCLCFLVSLLDHPLNDTTYDSPLLSALAVHGLRADGGWVTPQLYTGHYSAVIKVARLLAVHHAKLQVSEWDGPDPDRPKLYDVVRGYVSRFLTHVHADSNPTPIDWIYGALSYGLKICFETPTTGQISWADDKITYRDVSFTVRALGEMLQVLVKELACTMDKLTFASLRVKHKLPHVDWDRLHDNVQDTTVGHSFLHHPENTWMEPGRTWLIDRISAEPFTVAEWFRQLPDRRKVVVTKTASEYLKQVDSFKESLLVAIHLLAGQPARTTELLGIRFINTQSGGLRNIIIEDRMVGIVCKYHKGYERSGQTKVIYRYLPRELGDSVVRYIWFVVPFCQLLEANMSSSYRASPYVWDTHFVYDVKKVLDEDSVSCRLWRSDRMRRILIAHTTRLLHGTKLNVQSWRHIAIAIARKRLNGIFSSGEFGCDSYEAYDSEDDVGAAQDSPLDLQAGHSTHVAHVAYGRLATQGNQGIASQQEQFRKASILWHHLIGFTPPGSTKAIKRVLAEVEKDDHHVRRKRLKQLRQTDLDGQLRQLLQNPNAVFRRNQKDTLELVTQGASPVVQVAGTGGGKSMTFLLPAFCLPEATTVVIVPFVALQQDIMERCRTIPITCQEFRHFLNRLKTEFRLDRIVLDECHTILDTSYEFRPQLQLIGSEINSIGTQLVFLTATLPPRDEANLFGLLHIPPGLVKTVRAITSRPNIRYSIVRTPKPEGEITEVRRRVEGLPQDIGDPCRPRSIIYCQRLPNVQERAKVVRQWMIDGGPIVATSALGAGIDIPDESGRAGRDGLPSSSIVVVQSYRTVPSGRDAVWDMEDIREYVQDEVLCRRTILSRVMDGRVDRVGCEEGEELCDLYQATVVTGALEELGDDVAEDPSIPYERTIDEAVVREGVLRQRTQDEVLRLAAVLQRFTTVDCWTCFTFGSPRSYVAHPTCYGRRTIPGYGDDEEGLQQSKVHTDALTKWGYNI